MTARFEWRQIGAMVAPLEGDEVIKAAQRANDERAETLLDRMKRWALRPRDIFSLKLFGGGKGISQVYRRGHLPSDASCMILDPKSQGLKRWDVFIMFLLLYTAIVTPYEVGFSEPQLDFWFFLNRFIDLSFLVVRSPEQWLPSTAPHTHTHTHSHTHTAGLCPSRSTCCTMWRTPGLHGLHTGAAGGAISLCTGLLGRFLTPSRT